MKAQQSQPPKKANGPSYEYFNAEQNGTLHSTTTCHRCNNPSVYDKCTFCEFNMCQSCLQQCSACEYVYCGGCSVLEYVLVFFEATCQVLKITFCSYSLSVDQVFCISCIQH